MTKIIGTYDQDYKTYSAEYISCWAIDGNSINSEHEFMYTTDLNVVEYYKTSYPNIKFTEVKAINIYIDCSDCTEQDENCGIFILGKKIM